MVPWRMGKIYEIYYVRGFSVFPLPEYYYIWKMTTSGEHHVHLKKKILKCSRMQHLTIKQVGFWTFLLQTYCWPLKNSFAEYLFQFYLQNIFLVLFSSWFQSKFQVQSFRCLKTDTGRKSSRWRLHLIYKIVSFLPSALSTVDLPNQ